MDYELVQSLVKEESEKGELLIYIAIGCSLERYEEGAHPQQQYPPFMKEFPCNQVCVLIDPRLELPPRSVQDIAITKTSYKITILPILDNFMFEHNAFLHSLIDLCMNPNKHTKMIVQDFSGRDIRPLYPIHLYGERLLTHVLFDTTYGEGGCFPDLSAITILQTNGAFQQPQYMKLCRLYEEVPKEIAKREFTSRRYPIYKISMMYRISQNREETRDWCSEEEIQAYFPQYCKIYTIHETEFPRILYQILVAIVNDLCQVTKSYLTETEIDQIVRSKGREWDAMWKIMYSMLFE
jgi:hypothetical protein